MAKRIVELVNTGPEPDDDDRRSEKRARYDDDVQLTGRKVGSTKVLAVWDQSTIHDGYGQLDNRMEMLKTQFHDIVGPGNKILSWQSFLYFTREPLRIKLKKAHCSDDDISALMDLWDKCAESAGYRFTFRYQPRAGPNLHRTTRQRPHYYTLQNWVMEEYPELRWDLFEMSMENNGQECVLEESHMETILSTAPIKIFFITVVPLKKDFQSLPYEAACKYSETTQFVIDKKGFKLPSTFEEFQQSCESNYLYHDRHRVNKYVKHVDVINLFRRLERDVEGMLLGQIVKNLGEMSRQQGLKGKNVPTGRIVKPILTAAKFILNKMVNAPCAELQVGQTFYDGRVAAGDATMQMTVDGFPVPVVFVPVIGFSDRTFTKAMGIITASRDDLFARIMRNETGYSPRLSRSVDDEHSADHVACLSSYEEIEERYDHLPSLAILTTGLTWQMCQYQRNPENGAWECKASSRLTLDLADMNSLSPEDFMSQVRQVVYSLALHLFRQFIELWKVIPNQ
jgi:hypothetical protein